MTVSKAKQLADWWFSRYIRVSRSDKDGICKCVTCSTREHWEKIQNGHFMPRQHMATRYNEKNNGPQCVTCNGFNEGMQFEYSKYLDKTHGKGTAEKLQALSRTFMRMDTFMFTAIASEYRKLCIPEFKSRGIPWKEAPGGKFLATWGN